MKPLYKSGDKVKIRSDLVPYAKRYYGIYKNGTKTEDGEIVCDSMLKFSGKTVIIKRIINSPIGNCFGYIIEEDRKEWRWTDEMFEDINPSCYFESLL